MNIENIRCFISLAECLNFTKAAMKEHISQTTMSRKISVLEEELGVTLLYRDTREVHLTTAGNHFYAHAVKLLDLYDDAVTDVQKAQNIFQSELKIGIGTYEHVLLSGLLESYASRVKHMIKFSCQSAHGLVLAQDFIDGLFDLIICADQYENSLLASKVHSLGILPLHSEPYCLIIHKDSPMAAMDPVPLKELGTQTLITMRPDRADAVRKAFQNFFPFQSSLQVNSLNSKLVLVNAGLGFSWLPKYATQFDPCFKNIVIRKTLPPYHARATKLYYKKDSQNPAVIDFVNTIKKNGT